MNVETMTLCMPEVAKMFGNSRNLVYDLADNDHGIVDLTAHNASRLLLGEPEENLMISNGNNCNAYN
jgi:hypothetical protein